MDTINDIQFLSGRFIIKYHPSLQDDLHDVIDKSGCHTEFMKVFMVRLRQLSEYGSNAVKYFSKNFEVLKHEAGNMCSMRITTKNLNLRILYSFVDDRDIILLHGFYKRSNKKASDYSNHIPTARRRLTEILGGKDDE